MHGGVNRCVFMCLLCHSVRPNKRFNDYTTMNIDTLKASVRNVPDFPIPGIQFKDVTTLFKEPNNLRQLAQLLKERYADKGITKVVGIESRGFIMGPILALELGAGFVPIRKPGKLPAETIEESYEKEYGRDTIQMHRDALSPDVVVLLHDDLLATGGTMLAAYRLVRQAGVKQVYINFLIELADLRGRGVFPPEVEVDTLMSFDK